MKLFKLITLIIFLSIPNFSCVQDDDYSIPESVGLEENQDLTQLLDQINNGEVDLMTISQVKSLYNPSTSTTQFESNIAVKGYVVSSDMTGNFYKEFYMQDSPDSPTAGIKVTINQVDSYNQYNIGREVYIKLQNLYIGPTHGDSVLTIGGSLNGNEIEELNENFASEVILRSSNTFEIIPLSLTLPEIDASHIGQFISIESVQFPNNLSGLTYVDPYEDYDTQRALETCVGTFNPYAPKLETSAYANFDQNLLPTDGSGTLSGVLSKDYFGDDLVIMLNSKDDVVFDSPRCDPPVIDCGLASAEGSNILFQDDFEAQDPYTSVSGNGWTNYIESGTETFEAYSGSGSNPSLGVSVRIGSYQSGDASSVAWLITPAIDLTANPNATLTFQTSNSYSDGSTLELQFSKNWDGTTEGISSAEWGVVPAAYITADSDFYGDWFDSGIVDLSCAEGTVNFAFKYVGGGDSDIDGSYEIDNIRIAN
ncbi:MAG: DUF5689 domain-containing protein [Flavobacteriaceae bacterium]|nr:DUF5689 domain-containing protein [Flavobacteriaceae bacterium]|tara:strand:+ start:866 stop:2308 length:1443 start_codon:yes stop_codon:yes gene_type:complete